MKIADLFNIIIKVFGLFIVRDMLFSLGYLAQPFLSMAVSNTYIDTGALIVSLLVIALYLAIAYALIFKTASFVKMMKLEPELSDEYITFNISSGNVLNIALIIMSGYVLIDAIPDFCLAVINYYNQLQEHFPTAKPSLVRSLMPLVRIIIALLIIGERKRIIALVDKNTDHTPEELPDEQQEIVE